MRENSFTINLKPDREIVWMPTQHFVFLKLHCSHICLAHYKWCSRKFNTEVNKLLWFWHANQSNTLR